ncbi:TetR/AcrR family transcriptional regulator [Gudongella oleilytica]|jgi:AcrR family transcriptional regulator|uniref:TetR/AcrR family transcriptional regulator n=1 Tax=Gudongella oleilytica TaxID=1582259 RepID=UPI000FF878E6|nr:TetR/AcrR family transcriptional regulator [Gudongella oleilytica]
MNRKNISTRQYYIEAAAKIIRDEGYENITVRRLSEATGYTFPTLYHHFKDMGNLMWYARNHLISNMVSDLSGFSSQSNDIAGIKKAFGIYMDYYLDYPNVFRFFYYYQHQPDLNDLTSQELGFSDLWFDTLGFLVKEGRLSPDDLGVVAKTIIYSIHGMISLYLSGSGEINRDGLNKELDAIIDILLKGRIENYGN